MWSGYSLNENLGGPAHRLLLGKGSGQWSMRRVTCNSVEALIGIWRLLVDSRHREPPACWEFGCESSGFQEGNDQGARVETRADDFGPQLLQRDEVARVYSESDHRAVLGDTQSGHRGPSRTSTSSNRTSKVDRASRRGSGFRSPPFFVLSTPSRAARSFAGWPVYQTPVLIGVSSCHDGVDVSLACALYRLPAAASCRLRSIRARHRWPIFGVGRPGGRRLSIDSGAPSACSSAALSPGYCEVVCSGLLDPAAGRRNPENHARLTAPARGDGAPGGGDARVGGAVESFCSASALEERS